MGKLSNKELSQLIHNKIEELDRLHELKSKVELIESEIVELIGEDFNPEEFFGDDGTAALSYFEKEIGDDFTPLGTFEDPNDFIGDLKNASDEEAERLAPQYYAENIIYEDEDGQMHSSNQEESIEEDMTSREFKIKYGQHPRYDDIKQKLLQRATSAYPKPTKGKDDGDDVKQKLNPKTTSVYPELTRGKGDELPWFIKTKQTNFGKVKTFSDNSYIYFKGQFELFGKTNTRNFNDDVEVTIGFFKENPEYSQIDIYASSHGRFYPANRKSANRLAKELSPLFQEALKGLNKKFAQGELGGYSEENRNLIKKMNIKLANLKANDFMGQGSL